MVQSVTKTLCSSGFGVCGAVIARKNLTTNIDNDALKSDFASYVKYLPNRDYGPNLHPMQAIMALNDMRTLRSKVDLMSRNTMRVAEFLERHPAVESVQYLGLPNHPLHELASRYMWLVDAEHDELYGKPVNRYGHLLSFCVRGGAGSRAQDVRQAAAHLAGDRPGPHQERGHHSRHLDAPAARRERPRSWPTSRPTWSASASAPNTPTT